LELVCRRNLKFLKFNILEMQAKEALECCKQSLMGNSGGSSEDQNARGNEDSKDMLLRFQMGSKTI
jgi:hypothetical protein